MNLKTVWRPISFLSGPDYLARYNKHKRKSSVVLLLSFAARVLCYGVIPIFCGCSSSQLYEIRAGFLKPVNYTGSLCRMTENTKTRIYTPHSEASNPETVKAVLRLLGGHARLYSVSVFDPESGYYFRLNSDLFFHAASTYKSAVFLAIMKMDQEREVSLNHKIEVVNDFKSIVDHSSFSIDDDESEKDEIFENIGKKVPLKKLLEEMIEKSSNLATNILIDHFGAERINEKLGQMESSVHVTRGVSDNIAYANCLNNTISARQLENLYRLIFNPKIFDAPHQKLILKIMEENTKDKVIRRKLPEGVKVAHKNGYTSKVFHDTGIVFAKPKSPYFISLLSSYYKSGHEISMAMSEVSLLIYNDVMKARENSN